MPYHCHAGKGYSSRECRGIHANNTYQGKVDDDVNYCGRKGAIGNLFCLFLSNVYRRVVAKDRLKERPYRKMGIKPCAFAYSAPTIRE